jgi:hypothetical protein
MIDWKKLAFVMALAVMMIAAVSRIELVRQDLSLIHPIAEGYGRALNDTTLTAALTAISSAPKTIMLTPGNWTIANNLTIPANVTLQPSPGVTITLNPAVTLTINGPFHAPNIPIFTGTGLVHFGPAVPHASALWFGSAMTDATLSAAVARMAGQTKALRVSGGTWTIASSVTIPVTAPLIVDPGTLFSVNVGQTLTINSPLTAPLSQIFSGSGTVALGQQTAGVYPHWWGAKCDNSANDTSALSAALTVAGATKRSLLIPASATCRITSQLTVPDGVGIRGENWKSSVIQVVGGVKGLSYTSSNTENPEVRFENFSVLGSVGSALNLFEISGGAWNVVLDRVRLRGTSQKALVLNQVPGLTIQNCEIGEFALAGISTAGWTNGITVEGCRFEDFGTAHAVAAIEINSTPLGSGVWHIRRNVFESNTQRSKTALFLNNAHDILFEGNYVERYADTLILTGSGAPVANVTIKNNYLHSFYPFKVNITPGSLVHSNWIIEGNGFAGVSPGVTKIFSPGAASGYRYLHNSADAVPDEYVAGFPSEVTADVVKAGPLVFTGSVAIGDWNRVLQLLPGDIFQIANAVDFSKIRLHVGGTNAVDVEEEKVTFSKDIIVPQKIRVGNAATAAGPVGTIVKKIPVYDTSGTLLGYWPVYDAIP